MNQLMIAALCFWAAAALYATCRVVVNTRADKIVRKELREIYGDECCRLIPVKEPAGSVKPAAENAAAEALLGQPDAELGVDESYVTAQAVPELHTKDERGG